MKNGPCRETLNVSILLCNLNSLLDKPLIPVNVAARKERCKIVIFLCEDNWKGRRYKEISLQPTGEALSETGQSRKNVTGLGAFLQQTILITRQSILSLLHEIVTVHTNNWGLGGVSKISFLA